MTKEKGIILKNGAKVQNFVNSLIIRATLQVKSTDGYEDLKLNQELTEAVAKFIESEIFHDGTVKSSQLDKNAILKEVMSQCYTMSEDDIKVLEGHITYFIENKIIKKKGKLYKLYMLIKRFIVATK